MLRAHPLSLYLTPFFAFYTHSFSSHLPLFLLTFATSTSSSLLLPSFHLLSTSTSPTIFLSHLVMRVFLRTPHPLHVFHKTSDHISEEAPSPSSLLSLNSLNSFLLACSMMQTWAFLGTTTPVILHVRKHCFEWHLFISFSFFVVVVFP